MRRLFRNLGRKLRWIFGAHDVPTIKPINRFSGLTVKPEPIDAARYNLIGSQTLNNSLYGSLNAQGLGGFNYAPRIYSVRVPLPTPPANDGYDLLLHKYPTRGEVYADFLRDQELAAERRRTLDDLQRELFLKTLLVAAFERAEMNRLMYGETAPPQSATLKLADLDKMIDAANKRPVEVEWCQCNSCRAYRAEYGE